LNAANDFCFLFCLSLPFVQDLVPTANCIPEQSHDSQQEHLHGQIMTQVNIIHVHQLVLSMWLLNRIVTWWS